jgi:hypothetical protein
MTGLCGWPQKGRERGADTLFDGEDVFTARNGESRSKGVEKP